MEATHEERLQHGSGFREGQKQMQDITGSEEVEIKIRNDGKVIWINTAERAAVLRICQIKKLDLIDERPAKGDNLIEEYVKTLEGRLVMLEKTEPTEFMRGKIQECSASLEFLKKKVKANKEEKS